MHVSEFLLVGDSRGILRCMCSSGRGMSWVLYLAQANDVNPEGDAALWVNV